ncbi:hypothetical protein AM305_02933, partial [Actinobacillus minor NM305]
QSRAEQSRAKLFHFLSYLKRAESVADFAQHIPKIQLG